LVNGKKVDRPSYAIQVGDVISLREKSQKIKIYQDNLQEKHLDLAYVSLDRDKYQGVLTRLPDRAEVPITIDDHLVIEFYSKII
jgi:small subunit ribosomal protein S4